jgi:hypothetical protein
MHRSVVKGPTLKSYFTNRTRLSLIKKVGKRRRLAAPGRGPAKDTKQQQKHRAQNYPECDGTDKRLSGCETMLDLRV